MKPRPDPAHAEILDDVRRHAAHFHETMRRLERGEAPIPVEVYFRTARELLDEEEAAAEGGRAP